MNLATLPIRKEDITVFEAGTTFTDDGLPTYTAVVKKGCWFDTDKVIQTGINTSITAKAYIILTTDCAYNSKIERGNKSVISTNTNAIIKKEVLKNHQTGEIEGVVIYL